MTMFNARASLTLKAKDAIGVFPCVNGEKTFQFLWFIFRRRVTLFCFGGKRPFGRAATKLRLTGESGETRREI